MAGTFFTYGAVFFDRLAPLYLVGLIARDFGVPSAAEGTLALLIGLGWAGAMPILRATTGRVDDRNRVVAASVFAGATGLISATAGTWLAFVALRGIGGLAAGTGSPAVTSIVFAAAPAHRRGLDLGIVQSSSRIVGSLVSPVVVTAVAVAAGWRAAIAVSAALLLVGAVVTLVAVPRVGSRHRPRGPVQAFSLRPGGARNVALCTVACVVLLAWLTVWSQSSVQLLRSWLGLDPDAAGRLVAAFGVGSGAAALLVPIASDWLGRRRALALASVAGGAGAISLGALVAAATVPPAWVVVTILVLCGVALGGLPLVISIIPAESVAEGDVGRALLAPIAFGEVVGAAALPALAAVVASQLGLPVVMTLAGCAVLSLAVVSAFLQPLPAARARRGRSREGGASSGDRAPESGRPRRR